MAHRPCLLSVHAPSATAGMTSLHDHLRPILGCTQQAGQSHLNSDATIAHEGRPQGGEGTHKGCPYRLPSLSVLPWEGHPQGVPLPIVLSRRFALRRAPTRGAPTDCPLSAFCPGKGTHKGCPYRLPSLSVLPWEGHPQGVPLPIVFSRRFALRRAPTRGAPTDCLLSAFCPGKGTHKGCPYRLSSLGVLPWEGHPQGVPLPIVLSRRFALRRAPTRGAPTDCPLSAFCPEKGAHKGRPYPIQAASRGFSNLMQLP